MNKPVVNPPSAFSTEGPRPVPYRCCMGPVAGSRVPDGTPIGKQSVPPAHRGFSDRWLAVRVHPGVRKSSMPSWRRARHWVPNRADFLQYRQLLPVEAPIEGTVSLDIVLQEKFCHKMGGLIYSE
jgi:hypothetical protein